MNKIWYFAIGGLLLGLGAWWYFGKSERDTILQKARDAKADKAKEVTPAPDGQG